MKSQNWQKGQIKMLQKNCNIDDNAYRAMLEPYGVKSSKDLEFHQANLLIDTLRGYDNPNYTPKARKKKYSELDEKPERKGLASSAQLRMLEGIWKTASYIEDPKARNKALNEFCVKKVGYKVLELNSYEIRKMIKTVETMAKKGL